MSEGLSDPDQVAAVERALAPLVALVARAAESVSPRVSSSQLQALMCIARQGTVNLTGLAEALGAIASSASRLVDRLVAAGLVARTAATQDRREVSIRLTQDGQALLDEVRDVRLGRLDHALAALTARERRALLQGLTALAREVEPVAAPGAAARDSA